MIFILLLASLAIGTASDIAREGAQSLRLPIRSSGSSPIGTRDDPRYGHPLKVNATEKHYLSPYTVELSVGTPPQLVYPALDLFANNVWLNPDCVWSSSFDACYANGIYNPHASTSAGGLDCSQPWEFNYTYSGASGCHVVDNIQFSGASLDNVQVGIANKSWDQTAGRLGLGFGCHGEGDISIVDALQSQGLITSRQFSIALGSANPSAGTEVIAADVGLGELLFSGINTRKYAGELRKLYSHPAPEGDPRYYITLTAMGIFDPSDCIFGEVYEPAHRAFFDYTILNSYLPAVYIQTITEYFPSGTVNYTEGFYEVPCYYRSREASVDFYFDTHTISVPLRDFILEINNICILAAIDSTDDKTLISMHFSKKYIAAFDLDDEAIYMAQYENCGDQVINWNPLAADGDGLCASSPRTLPLSCYSTSTSASSTSTTHSTTTTHRTTSTTHSTTSTHPLRTSTSRPTSHSSTHSSTRSTTSTRKTSTTHSTTSSRTTSTSSSTHSTSKPRTTSTSTHSREPRPSSHETSSSRSRISSTTGTNHTTTSSPWSSGVFSPTGIPSGGSIFWSSQLSTGFSWSNVSFTPTPGRTPKPTTSHSSETSTLTSLPASSTTRTSRSTSFRSGTLTVGILTSTVFMPSPITVPHRDCKCAGAVTVAVAGEPEEGLASCDAVTEYRTQTVPSILYPYFLPLS
ncbi:acid protease [Xylaria cf. heliscus]|nr:acid protease [Xylaria cf. heliscus]